MSLIYDLPSKMAQLDNKHTRQPVSIGLEGLGKMVWKVYQVKDISKQTEVEKGLESSEGPTGNEGRRSRGPSKGPTRVPFNFGEG